MSDYTKNYTPTEWVDGAAPSLNAANLNNIEGFISELDDRTKELKSTKEDRKSTRAGGTDDYNALVNKPSINGVTLVGDMTLADLGIASATDLSALAELVGNANAVLEVL